MPRVRTVENGGLLFTDNPAGVSGVDAGYSIPMGRSILWLFGDVFLLHPTDPKKPYVGGLSNAALVVPAGPVSSLKRYRFLTDPATGVARQVIPNRPDEGTETRLWPLGGWYDPVRAAVYLFYAKVVTTGPGPFDFRVVGHGLARSNARKPLEIRFERLRTTDGDDLWWQAPEPLYGSAVFRSRNPSDPYLYVVGVDERDGSKRATLARVPRATIEQLSDYEYWAGDGRGVRWSRNPGDAAPLHGLRDFPTELSVAYNRHLGGYLAVHSVGITERIRLVLAQEPWGPYEVLDEIGAPHRAFERAFCYAGKEHPELAERGGAVIYITYVDSQRYWLQLLKVTLD